jgi:hypothetical protein
MRAWGFGILLCFQLGAAMVAHGQQTQTTTPVTATTAEWTTGAGASASGYGQPMVQYNVEGPINSTSSVKITCGDDDCPAGLYRISAYLTTTRAEIGSKITIALSFHDGPIPGPHTPTLVTLGGGVIGGFAQIPSYVYYSDGSAVTATATVTGSPAATWFASAVVERLR